MDKILRVINDRELDLCLDDQKTLMTKTFPSKRYVPHNMLRKKKAMSTYLKIFPLTYLNIFIYGEKTEKK